MAVANEEGGIRIVDVDVGMGIGGMEGGWWWRGHGNAIFDMKWSADDSRVVSSSIQNDRHN
jgi:denticleless